MPHEHSFANGYAVTVDAARGRLTIAGKNGTIGPSTSRLLIEGGTEAQVLKKARVDFHRGSSAHHRPLFRAGGLDGAMVFRQRADAWLGMSLALTNRSRADVRLAHVDVLRLESASGFAFGGKPRDLRLLSNPRGMAYFAGTRDILPKKGADQYDLGPNRPNGAQAYERWNQSWMIIAAWDKRSRKGVVMGAAQPMHEALQFVTEDEVFRCRCFPDSRLIAAGATVHSPEVQINLVDPPREGMEAYAELNRQDLPVRDLLAYAGWNSFDYFLNTETLDGIVENAEEIRATQELRDRIKWVTVDSGWEYRWGEYVAVEHRFPGGLPNLVRQMRKRGLQTGIWTAPLMVERWSTRVTRWDPEVLCAATLRATICRYSMTTASLSIPPTLLVNAT